MASHTTVNKVNNGSKTHPNGPARSFEQQAKAIGDIIHRKTIAFPERGEAIGNILLQPWGQQAARMAAAILIEAFAATSCPQYPYVGRTLRKWHNALRRQEDHADRDDSVLGLAIRITQALRWGRATILEECRNAGATYPMQSVSPTGTETDRAGQAIQRTVTNRKQTANYHSKPAVATLIAELAVPAHHTLANTPAKELRVIDPACGSGILLTAASSVIQERLAEGEPDLHKTKAVTVSLTGIDIIPTSVAFAKANIAALNRPNTKATIFRMNHTDLPAGGREPCEQAQMGAVDLLDPESPGSQRAREFNPDIRRHRQHIVLVNPPYTRKTNGPAASAETGTVKAAEPAETPQTGRTVDSTHKLAYKLGEKIKANPRNGMALYFAHLAIQLVKTNGVIALTLPTTALLAPPSPTGGGWHHFRNLIAQRFSDVTILTTAGRTGSDFSFSEDTNIAEAILIARRVTNKEQAPGTARFISLNRLPSTKAEAKRFAQSIRDAAPQGPDSISQGQTTRLNIDDETVGSQTHAPTKDVPLWVLGGVQEPRTVETTLNICKGSLRRNEGDPEIRIPIARLGDLASFPRVQTNVSSYLDIAAGPPVPPAVPYLHLHSGRTQTGLLVEPGHHGIPTPGHEASAKQVQDRAGTLQVSLCHRYNSQPLGAAVTAKPCLTGKHWGNLRLHRRIYEHAIAVWMNTTIGLCTHWTRANRTQAGLGLLASHQAHELPVLDLATLSSTQLNRMEKIFTQMQGVPLMPAADAWRDPVRIELDRRVLIEVLNITRHDAHDVVEWLRNAWCLEPSIQGQKATRAIHQDSMTDLKDTVRQAETKLAEAPRAWGTHHSERATTDKDSEAVENEAAMGISPQFLRDLAEALERGGRSAQYQELRLTANPEGINMSATDLNGQTLDDLPDDVLTILVGGHEEQPKLLVSAD